MPLHMIPGYLKKGKVEINSETIANHFAKDYEILKPVINKIEEEAKEIDIYKLDRLPIDVLDVKKSAVKKAEKHFWTSLIQEQMRRNFHCLKLGMTLTMY